jgi:nucleotide-binding universal stress UspA family protein
MRDSFKTILIPVDFSINTEVAIKKALDIIGCDEATIYLLHICPAKSLAQAGDFEKQKEEQLLDGLKETIENSHEGITVNTRIECNDSVQEAIVKAAKAWVVDLIIVGQKSTHSWFPFLNTVMPVDLAERSGIAVLTVKPGALHCKIRTLVMPVVDDVSKQKVEAVLALSKNFKLKIHLVTFAEGNRAPSEFSKLALLKAFQWLKDTMHCTVEYAVLKGYNKAKAILDYSKKIDADILLVHTNSETKIGSFNRHISNVLPAASRMQVLTMQSDFNSPN